MKGKEQMIEQLNARLADELTAINQYFVHAELCEDWGYEKLHSVIKERSIMEMKHAEKLIERIIFLEGRPIVSNLNKISIGSKIDDIHQNDWNAELGAIEGYNEAIRLAAELGDNGTKTLLEEILSQEEMHIDWLETQKDQIEQLGIQLYLSEQTG